MVNEKIIGDKIRSNVWVYKPNNPYSAIEYVAVWDTGSSRTLISEKVVKELQLDLTGEKIKIGNIQSQFLETGIYYCAIFLSDKIKPFGVESPLIPVSRTDCDVIIGLDIIMLGEFKIAGDVFTYK